MLVIGRHIGGSFFIDVPPSTEHRQIKMMLTDIRKPTVARIGIVAPKEMNIVREELVPKPQGETKQ